MFRALAKVLKTARGAGSVNATNVMNVRFDVIFVVFARGGRILIDTSFSWIDLYVQESSTDT